MPAGRLREPSRALARADFVVITRAEHAPAVGDDRAQVQRRTGFLRAHGTWSYVVESAGNGWRRACEWPTSQKPKFLAFCGIGNSAAFFYDLRRWGFSVVAERAFRDHHRYRARDMAELEEEAASSRGAMHMICTEKDIFNLRRAPATRIPLYACRIRLTLSDGDAFWNAVREAVERRRQVSGSEKHMKILVRANQLDWRRGDGHSCAAGDSRPLAGGRSTILARPSVADLYRGQDLCRPSSSLTNIGTAPRILGEGTAGRAVAPRKFDVAVLLQNAFEAAWLAWRAGIPERIGYARDARSWLLTRAVTVPPKAKSRRTNRTITWSCCAGRMAGKRCPLVERIDLAVTEAAREAAGRRLVAAGARDRPRLGGLRARRRLRISEMLAAERYAALGGSVDCRLRRRCDTFRRSRRRAKWRRASRRAMRKHARSIWSARRIPAELPALLGGLPTSLSATIPARCTWPPRWVCRWWEFLVPPIRAGTSPVTPQFSLVRQPVSCSPCFLRHCPIDHRCMTRISVDEVFGAAWRIAGVRAHGEVTDQ